MENDGLGSFVAVCKILPVLCFELEWVKMLQRCPDLEQTKPRVSGRLSRRGLTLRHFVWLKRLETFGYCR